MRRAIAVLAIIGVGALLGACSSGGGDETTGGQVLPLVIQLMAATPSSGPSPLRVTFTANITGGKAPYYYSWDYTNDGAPDRFINAEFQRTVSVQQDYYARASDPGGVSQYQAVMKVMDSEGTEVTSDPVTVVVGTGSMTVVLEESPAISDEPDGQGGYIYRSGQPVYFIVKVIGGQEPYRYQWDFNEDGAIDSTVARPQFTWMNQSSEEALIVNPRVTVVDDNDVKVAFDWALAILGPDQDPPPPDEFAIVLNASPAANAQNIITLEFDPSGTNESVPLEPQLDLAVIVDPEMPGKPPYEYYWDFETDGAFDAQVVSPTIPFYDDSRKIFVNPYMHNLSQKVYQLRCMVIDSGGQVREIHRTVISKNISGALGLLSVTPIYGVTSIGGQYIAPPGSDPPVPFGSAADQNQQSDAKFEVTVTGSTGVYQYQFDANGDGTPEVPGGGGWEPAVGGSGTTITQSTVYAGVGYFPARMKIRSVDTNGTQVDIVTVEMPVNIVIRNLVGLTEGTLKKRYDHGLAASWVAQPGGGNGQYLASREICLIGGAQGSTPIRDVERIVQSYNPPAGAGQFEQLFTTVASARLPMNQERRGIMVWTLSPSAGSTYYVHGGNNLINGVLASNESSTGGDAGAAAAWSIMSELRAPEYYPLSDMAGAFVSGTGLLFTGGKHPPSDSDIDNVNGRLIVYDTAFDSYGVFGPPMVTERYDSCAAFINNRLYIIGGRVASGQSVATVEAFNMNTNQWELAPPLQSARSGAVSAVIGGRVYVIGGAFYPSDESASSLVNSAEVFNPITGVWTYTLSLPEEALVNNAAGVAVPGPGSVNAGGAVVNTLFVTGGEDDNGETNRLFEFIYLHTVAPPGP